ncbi:MAG: hypothetical protein H6736_07705 [Alphaproteobacteria bacterium]|nr:hypothetical protein [Alphaproteobacteria bacterium]MCB9691685.1 hypothetical protein [Alphaproteobacteria bacterium]
MSGVFERLVAEAAALADQGAWAEAAARWVTAGGLAQDVGAHPTAARLYATAGEGFRRADLPADALAALQLGLALGDPEPSARVALSAVLASLGRMGPALEHARAAEGPLAVDAEASVLLATGTRAELRACVERLEEGSLARRFREGQALRVEGRLHEARAVFEALEVDLADNPAGRGGAAVERAEIDALQGRGREAAKVFERAAQAHREAHREALVLASTAAAVRCLLDAGITPLVAGLEGGLAWAEARDMAVLAVDLGTCIARAREDGPGLVRWAEQARRLGLPRRAGRAELARAGLLEGPARLMALQEAVRLLEEDAPLALRARVAHAEALAALSPAAGARAARELVTAVASAGMEPERLRLAALEG